MARKCPAVVSSDSEDYSDTPNNASVMEVDPSAKRLRKSTAKAVAASGMFATSPLDHYFINNTSSTRGREGEETGCGTPQTEGPDQSASEAASAERRRE